MSTERDEQIKSITKQMLIKKIIMLPGAIMVGLALHTLFMANGNPVFSFLSNANVVYVMLAVGVAIMFIDYKQQLKLSRARIELQNEHGT